MLMKKSMFLAVLLLALLSRNTWGSLVQWSSGSGGNGNWYEAVSIAGGISWTGANDIAVSLGGYLATATSSAENNFIFSLIQSPEFWINDGQNSEGPWLGAYYDGPPDFIDTNNWNWVTEEAWSYANWATAEPTNYENEYYINYFAYQGGGTAYDSTWNNIPNYWPLGANGNIEVPGYIIEWDIFPVPVPPAIWLFGSGLLGIFVIGRKSRDRQKAV